MRSGYSNKDGDASDLLSGTRAWRIADYVKGHALLTMSKRLLPRAAP